MYLSDIPNLGSRYTLLGVVGIGATATVFHGQDTLDGDEVAIKVFHEETLRSPRLRKRVVRELRLASRVVSPHVVRLRDAVTTDGLTALVFDYEPLGSLAQLLARDRSLPVLEVLRITYQAGCGLAALHDAGIVHRDVKPENILFSREGLARLSDLGLACLMRNSSASGSTHVTSTGDVLGTVAYLAPESLDTPNYRPTPQSDIYALGVTAFQALTGQVPFSSDFRQLMAQKLAMPLTPVANFGVVVSPELQTWLDRCMARDPRNRFPTIKRALAELCAIRDVRSDQLEIPIAGDWRELRAQPTALQSFPPLRKPSRPAPEIEHSRLRQFETLAYAAARCGYYLKATLSFLVPLVLLYFFVRWAPLWRQTFIKLLGGPKIVEFPITVEPQQHFAGREASHADKPQRN